jgi:hypothetical protein
VDGSSCRRTATTETNASWRWAQAEQTEASNWHRVEVLPKYPVSSIEPGDSVRVPIVITLGGPAGIELGLRARLDDGTPYTRSQVITAY